MLVIEMFVKLNEHWHQQVVFSNCKSVNAPKQSLWACGFPKKETILAHILKKISVQPHDIRANRRPVRRLQALFQHGHLAWNAAAQLFFQLLNLHLLTTNNVLRAAQIYVAPPSNQNVDWTNMSFNQKHIKCGQQKHGFNWFNQLKCRLNQQNCWLNQSEIVFTNKNWDLINKNWIEPTKSGFSEQKCDWNQQKMIQPTQVKF